MIQFHDKQKEALSYLAIDNECRQLLYGGSCLYLLSIGCSTKV
jgi:hypothetical protein